MKLLQKIEWKTHRWNLKFNLMSIDLHDNDGCWGITIAEIIKDFRPYSLFSFEFRLPNNADRKYFQVTNWDLLYIATPLYKWMESMDEDMLWGRYEPNIFICTIHKFVSKLFN